MTVSLATAEEIIEEARNGRMFILVDDEDRENEGDLVIPAQMATPAAINFMATFGRGLICLALSAFRIRQLDLPLMSSHNGTKHETAFTVSIEAKEGVSTGISAGDRARTIATAIDGSKDASHIVTPGHVFPLMAREGGVLVRSGHTEAAVDVARLAGLNPSGVICEIMNNDGTMARMDDLQIFAAEHGLKIGTIRDLIAYRRQHDKFVSCIAEGQFFSDFGGEFISRVYRSALDGVETLVLQKGEIAADEPTLVRMHGISPFHDMLGQPGSRQRLLQRAMMAIGREGRGVLVLLRTDEADLMSRAVLGGEKPPEMNVRNVGIGAQILADLGINKTILLTNAHRHFVGIEGFGIDVVGERLIDG